MTTEAIRRPETYIWATWLSPILAGESHCQWSAWFQANHQFPKPSVSLNDWVINHDRLLQRRVRELEDEGFRVYIEDENTFKITSNTNGITKKVAGKADIVAIKGNRAIVEDCKTGKPKNADIMQVLTYMLLLPLQGGPRHCRDLKFEGRLVYNEEVLDIDSSNLDQNFKTEFRRLVTDTSTIEAARKVPSFRECKYCKISSLYCPDRVEEEENEGCGGNELF